MLALNQAKGKVFPDLPNRSILISFSFPPGQGWSSRWGLWGTSSKQQPLSSQRFHRLRRNFALLQKWLVRTCWANAEEVAVRGIPTWR